MQVNGPSLQNVMAQLQAMKQQASSSVASDSVNHEMRVPSLDSSAKSQAVQGDFSAGIESGVPEVKQPSFGDLFHSAIGKVNETQQQAASLARAYETGDSDVDITEVMIASQKASVSFQALTQVRNKVVEAYRDIMNMPM